MLAAVKQVKSGNSAPTHCAPNSLTVVAQKWSTLFSLSYDLEQPSAEPHLLKDLMRSLIAVLI